MILSQPLPPSPTDGNPPPSVAYPHSNPPPQIYGGGLHIRGRAAQTVKTVHTPPCLLYIAPRNLLPMRRPYCPLKPRFSGYQNPPPSAELSAASAALRKKMRRRRTAPAASKASIFAYRSSPFHFHFPTRRGKVCSVRKPFPSDSFTLLPCLQKTHGSRGHLLAGYEYPKLSIKTKNIFLAVPIPMLIPLYTEPRPAQPASQAPAPSPRPGD